MESHKAPLELVRADIFSPTRSPSLGNKRYFLLFIDDYTRMIWLYFIHAKLDAFSVFLEFKTLVERQSGYKIKTLRIDPRGGSSYTTHSWSITIQRQLIVSHNPQ